ncbi:MAG: hypothetical protein M0R49_01155 [Limnochordia bacterium]|nr:hypothetical protein [Limnochordia bacterium]
MQLLTDEQMCVAACGMTCGAKVCFLHSSLKRIAQAQLEQDKREAYIEDEEDGGE